MSWIAPTPRSGHPLGYIYQTGAFQLVNQLGDVSGPELSPPFIEWNPGYNRRMVVMLPNQLFQLRFILISRLSRPLNILLISPEAMVSVRHILPDQHTQFIGPVVPACRVHFYVLGNHVKAEVFGHPDVIFQGFIGRCRI